MRLIIAAFLLGIAADSPLVVIGVLLLGCWIGDKMKCQKPRNHTKEGKQDV